MSKSKAIYGDSTNAGFEWLHILIKMLHNLSWHEETIGNENIL